MNGKVGIYREKTSRIDYDLLLSLYEVTYLTSENKLSNHNFDVMVIDVKEIDYAREIMNEIREIKSNQKFIVIIENITHMAVEGLINNVNGIGPIELVYRYTQIESQFSRAIEKLINPSLPYKREEIAVVLPIYNEEKRLEYVNDWIRRLEHLSKQAFPNMAIILVNDGSSDQTEVLMKAIIEKNMNEESCVYYKEILSIDNLEYNTKKAGTYIEAFRSIDSDYIILADADNSFDIEDVAHMLNLIKQGYYDIVIGSKDKMAKDRKPIRRFLSFGKRIITKPLLPKGVTDSQTGLKVFRREAIQYMLPYLHEELGFAIDLELMVLAKRLGFRVKQIPIKIIDRDGSHVELVKDSIQYLKAIIRLITMNRKKV